MEKLVLRRRGRLYSHIIGRMPSVHFQPPYAVGYVDMPEGVRIFALLKEEESECKQLRIGMEMETVIEKIWQEEDNEIIGWKFKPVT